nr:MAG TPA: hypothetical protein [Caudoviricetes sp.]
MAAVTNTIIIQINRIALLRVLLLITVKFPLSDWLFRFQCC